jgi:hypothetical protein
MKFKWPIFGSRDGLGSSIAEVTSHGGRFASLLSAVALSFSGLSYYESVVKTADLEIYVAPVIQYGRDKEGYLELFAIPLTVVNSGARTGTVLSMNLEVEALDPAAKLKTAQYYSAYRGEHPTDSRAVSQAFAPMSLAGRETFSDTVRFYPAATPAKRLVNAAGDYRFTLTLRTAVPEKPGLLERLWRKDPEPVTFEKTLRAFSVQHLEFQRGTVPLRESISLPDPGPDPAPL